MPKIVDIDVNVSDEITIDGDPVDGAHGVQVNARIAFSRIERDLGMTYIVRIGLYEQDEGWDIPSLTMNDDAVRIRRAYVGAADDFMGLSGDIAVAANTDEVEVSHSFFEFPQPERDRTQEFRAVVICNPAVGTAVRWSGIHRSPPHGDAD